MKRTIVIIASIAVVLAAMAQDNQVRRIPERSSDHNVTSSIYENNSGFWIAAEASAGISLDSKNNVGFGEFDVTFGYRFNDYLRVGPGAGYRYYFPKNSRRETPRRWGMPIYFNVRGSMLSTEYRTVVPYYSIDLGGTIQDGFFWRPTVGLRIGQPRSAFILALSYVGQNLRTSRFAVLDNAGLPVSYNYKTRYTSFMSLRIGYEF